MKLTRHLNLIAAALLLAAFSQMVAAQDGPPQFVRDAVGAVLSMLDSRGDAAIETFIDTAMAPTEEWDRALLLEHLSAVRDEAPGPWHDVAVEAEPDGVRLILTRDSTEQQLRLVLGQEGITNVQLLEAAEPLVLTRDNLAATFDRLEDEGMSGVVYVRLGDEVVLERPFGMANEQLGIPNSLTTIFGTGSRPIDYTVAAVHLLAQRGAIRLSDTIDQYFEDVPADKRGITVEQLLTGRSGLPDFFHTAEDWDPDLAWVDRETAERRLLSQELLFEPGEDISHSHGAFGLLAALVEHVSGRSYYEFIRENLLDPAGMDRTGEYGETRGLTVSDFAAGGGPSFVGLPNIPPNWGPTSWLIKGSGGMYSTLEDLLRFYQYVRSGAVLEDEYKAVFLKPSVLVDGSDRGFELFSVYKPPLSEVYLLVNSQGTQGQTRRLFRALESLARSD
jgi:CubicO group peptidase (beta-lactamase class C family)